MKRISLDADNAGGSTSRRIHDGALHFHFDVLKGRLDVVFILVVVARRGGRRGRRVSGKRKRRGGGREETRERKRRGWIEGDAFARWLVACQGGIDVGAKDDNFPL